MPDLQSDKCLQFFSDIMRVLKTTHRYEPVFHLIVDRIVRLYECQSCAIVLINPKTEYLSVENSYGLSWTYCKEFRTKLATGPIGELLWTGKPILIADSEEEAQRAQELRLEHPFRSCCCVQICADHRTLGYLFADSAVPSAFLPTDIRVLQTLADLAGIAYDKCRLYEDNLRLERIDHETGIEKYEPFLEKVRAAMERAKTSREGFSLLILDVDNFKEIINTFCRESSILLLKEMGRLLQSRLRHIDAIGRYGIDEFIILLENTALEEGVEHAKNFRAEIEKASFTSNGIKTTVSIGLSSYPRNASTVEDLLITAKNALFEAQRAGRNKVYYYLKEWYAKEAVLDEV